MIRRRIALGALGGLLAGSVLVALAESPPGATVRPLPPGPARQQIEVLRPGSGQDLSQAERAEQGEQDIGVPEPKSSTQRAASTAGKVVLGVFAAAIAIGAAAASLLLL